MEHAEKTLFNMNATFSRNKTKTFNEYLYDYNTYEEFLILHSNSDISFSPAVIGAAALSYAPLKTWRSRSHPSMSANNTSTILPMNQESSTLIDK